jgi:branched-chain amino acid transport system ATP-binding protein
MSSNTDARAAGGDKSRQVHLEANRLSLNFGGLQAINDVSFNVLKGEILGMVGPNGAGKTCVLNLISGIYHPSKGAQIVFEGKDIVGLPLHKVVETGISRTFQHSELFPGMTVLENLLVGCHYLIRTNVFSAMIFWGLAQKEEALLREQVEEVIDFLELGKYRKKLVHGLPYGVQKLVGLGRALAQKPRLLLLDEPSSGMSRQEKEDFARFILRIKYQLGITILWVEHDVTLVSQIADRLLALCYGSKIAEGKTEDVVSNHEVIEAFLGVATESKT